MSSSQNASKTKTIISLLLYYFLTAGLYDGVYADLPHQFCPRNCSNPYDDQFLKSLENLLNSLSPNASISNFNKSSTGNNDSDRRVYGLYMCFGYSKNVSCKKCVASAVRSITKFCHNASEAVAWEDDCQLHYRDKEFFGYFYIVGNKGEQNPMHIAEPEQFGSAVKSILANLTKKAALDPSPNKYAFERGPYKDDDKISAAVLCLGDLTAEDSEKCLAIGIAYVSTCYYFSRRAIILSKWCYLYDFRSDGSGTQGAGNSVPKKRKNKVSSAIIIVASVVPVVATVLLVTTAYYFRMRAGKKHNALIAQENALNDTTAESLQYDFKSIETATSNFSDYNVLGQGGFGKVYKGELQDGREIAAKRLSKSSGQGAMEFKNEVVLAAKPQHRNLARLLGFCLEGPEKILVYEYVPNKSLDYFLFDAEKKCQMKWSIRANIIDGIVQGILYLHEDYRLKIIHRDLKAGNILLDENMNLKVSDFGMAKMFEEEEPQGSTKRVVGTYGYMAPEYAMEGLHSIKSDIYSFGVLLLEILSGRRNSSFQATDCAPSLVAYVWQLWNEGKALDMVDQCLRGSCHPNEFIRYIQIGLLCVQEDALWRPTMSSVALMLKSEVQSLPQPKRPAFITTRYTSHQEILVVNGCSVNEITVSEFFPR